MRTLLLLLGCAALALAGCQVVPRSAGRRAAVRANAISNKNTVTESPTLERPAPSVKER